ncbi:MAG: chemotaxis protein CheW [Magnetococcales bacterium]|nr:chemotaxis protein CheW [Magnetococcales bacterium]NGZ26340.1 chemotaxis protein CheW [Magnetococcales bacterium]
MAMAIDKRKAERILTFTLDRELYAVNIAAVREILDMTDITRIPQAMEFMRGVVNLRGNAVPVMDLRQRFALPATEATVNTRIIIMEHRDDKEITLMGALADSVKEVLELDPSQIDPPPRMGSRVNSEYIRGIGKHENQFIILLDAHKVFSFEEVAAANALVNTAGEMKHAQGAV